MVDAPDLPFTGGIVGYLGYECAALTLPVTLSHRSPYPDAYFVRPQSFIVYDHAEQTAHVCCLEDVHNEGVSGGDALLDRLERVVRAAEGASVAKGALISNGSPPPRPTTRLTYVRAADPRTRPEVKGPDFGALRAFRTRHQLEGTDDAVIVDAAGAMLETTTGALAAWDGEKLTVPDGVRLPSVTLHQAARRAREAGARVQRRRFTPEFAAAHPLWFLNSLHGISPVTELRSPEAPGVALHPPAHPGAAEWQSWWWGGFA